MLLLVCRHRGLDMRGGGDGGRFGGLKGGADGLRVELRIFGAAVFGDAIIYRSVYRSVTSENQFHCTRPDTIRQQMTKNTVISRPFAQL